MKTDAIRHRDEYRLRCGECGSNFCTSCRAEPYHLGKTCEQVVAHAAALKCRFCDEKLKPGEGAAPAQAAVPAGKRGRKAAGASSSSGGAAAALAITDVCSQPECRERAQQACPATLGCGHACCGVREEAGSRHGCLPCLHADCVAARGGSMTRDDYCNICWTEGLGAAPCIQLGCGHIVHKACAEKSLAGRWPGIRISFGFMGCPLCKVPMSHWSLAPVLGPVERLRKQVEEMAAARLRAEGMEKDALVASRFGGDKLKYAMDALAYYVCSKPACGKPFFGGRRVCGEAPAGGGGVGAQGNGAAAVGGNAEDLLCPGCQKPPPGVAACGKHGTAGLEYKCRYCW